jgi:hypothetical protein
MGLGKTAQALTSLALMRIEQAIIGGAFSEDDLTSGNAEHFGSIMTASAVSAPPCLIICPASVVPHWEAETRKFIPSCIFSVGKFTGKETKLGMSI